MKFFKVGSGWKTVEYPEASIGKASIAHSKYSKGVYLMEMVDGYEFFEVLSPIKVTELRIDGKVVMIDDPMHFIGMMRLAEACRGKVLVAGLGLGLILHHLVRNPHVTSIDVVEINPDVIALVKPMLPSDDRVTIHHDDALAYEWVHGDYDSIILDLWVKGQSHEKMGMAGLEGGPGLMMTTIRFQANNPRARVMVWGARDPGLNPAVEEVSDKYIEFVKEMNRE
jgi:hypothetical protein